MTNLFLCSFASPDLKRSVNRFIKQSSQISLYKNYKIFGWKDLSLSKKNKLKISSKMEIKDCLVMLAGNQK